MKSLSFRRGQSPQCNLTSSLSGSGPYRKAIENFKWSFLISTMSRSASPCFLTPLTNQICRHSLNCTQAADICFQLLVPLYLMFTYQIYIKASASSMGQTKARGGSTDLLFHLQQVPPAACQATFRNLDTHIGISTTILFPSFIPKL